VTDIDKKLRAVLSLIEKLTPTPEQVEPKDIEALRDEGLSDEAIEDAIHVTALFNIIDRIADSLGFEIPTAKSFARAAGFLLKRGY
jgi:alkylhydroperoxidase family enzyme